MSNDFCFYVETADSQGKLKSVKDIISKGKFEEEDIILVRILKASTQFEQEISNLVVVDEHPRVKYAATVTVFILGGFPHREKPFYEGEIIVLGNGSVSENEKGVVQLVFTRPQENIIIRNDFKEDNEEEISLDCVKFPDGVNWSSRDNKETMKSIKKWIMCGLIAAIPIELSINQASSKGVCRFNLACKVQDVIILSPYLGVLTVADGTICKQPIFTINENSGAEFKTMSQSNCGADIIVSIETVDLKKHIKKGSYIWLNDIQVKKFSFELSQIKECIIFKVDGRLISCDALRGNAKGSVVRLLKNTKGQEIPAENVFANTTHKQHTRLAECNDSNQFQTDINTSKLLAQRKRHLNETHNQSQNITQSSYEKSRKHLSSVERKRRTSNGQEDCLQPVASPNVCVSSQQNLNGTTNTNHSLIYKIFNSCKENTPGQNNAENFTNSSSPEDFIEDETIVNEKRTVLRRLKYLPGLYHVNVWIKDVSPSLLGSQLDLVKVRCSECRMEQRYSRHKNQQQLTELHTCSSCSRHGVQKFLDIQFHFTLILWDASDREISVCVTGDNAEKFLKCTAYKYISDEEIRKQMWSTLCKLKDRGCIHHYRCARDMIEVDVGVTVQKGTKKYILLGGVVQ